MPSKIPEARGKLQGRPQGFDQKELARNISPTSDDTILQAYMKYFGDRTLLSGGAISDNGNGTATVATGTAWAKASDADNAAGVFFSFDADATVSLSDMVTNYIFLDYNDGSPQIVVTTTEVDHLDKQDHILVGTIFRNDTTLHFHQVSTIGIGRINRTDAHHREEHNGHRVAGLVTSDDGSRTLAIAEVSTGVTGIIYEGVSRHETTVDGSTWSTWYYNFTTSAWVEVTGQSVVSNSQYNNIESGTGLVNLTSNRYAVHWVYVDIDGAHLHLVYGQGNYKVNEAEEAGVPVSLPPQVVGYGILIAKIIVQQGQAPLTITYPWTSVFASNFATDHGSQGGLLDDDHTQYVLATGTRAMSELRLTPKSSSSGPEGTMFYDSDDDSVYVATEV